MAKFQVQFPWPGARHGRMWQALSPGVPVKFRPHPEAGFLVWGVSPPAPKPAVLCLKDPELNQTPNTPSHWAEVLQTQGEGRYPVIWGSLHVETVQPTPF